jgi:hypothetical protein
MICPNCNKHNTIIFFNEDILCVHCNEINKIHCNVCQDCGFVWKDNEGQLVNDITFEDETLKELLEGVEIALTEEFDENLSTMGEVIHRCLRCETISYEIKQGLYHCPECSFEWEII